MSQPSKRGNSLTKQVKEHSRKKIQSEEQSIIPALPTGCSILNLACADDINFGFGTGRIVNIIGDSSAGKTMLSLSMLAEMAHNTNFDEYDLIYDDAEEKSAYDIAHLYGTKAKDRITPPALVDDEPQYSHTIQDFRNNLFTQFEKGKPFAWVLDSFDALTSEEEIKKVNEHIDATKKGKPTTGTYGMDKAKGASQLFRTIARQLKKTKSKIIIVSQTRDPISANTFATKTRSGGRALYFYCTHEIWLAVLKKIKKKVRGIDIEIGADIRAKIKKNHLTGKMRIVEFPIYSDHGVDDIGAMIDFMLKWGFWTKPGSKIKSLYDADMTREKLIKYIEEKGDMRIKRAVQKAWLEIEGQLKLNRKRKFE